MTAPRTVSVVVPHFNDLVGLDLCLSGLRRQTYPESAYEIIVADNASPQGPAAVSAVIGDRARLVVVPEKGAGPARNGGAALAGGEILAFIDSDCRPDPDWLTQGVEALGACDFVGGRVEVLVDDVHRMTASEAFERVFAFDNEAYVTRKGFSVSANLFCPRALFDAVGGFAVGVSEDVDWCHRALKAGYRIGYAPRAVIGHPARRTWTDLLKKWRRRMAASCGWRAVCFFRSRPSPTPRRCSPAQGWRQPGSACRPWESCTV
jgi:glycosyltransferase involved in cell wall biosynthesis